MGNKSFWQTLPGILTGIAAIITAVGGIYLGLLDSSDSVGMGQEPPGSERPPDTVAVDESIPSFGHGTIIDREDFSDNERNWYIGESDNDATYSKRELRSGKYYWDLTFKSSNGRHIWGDTRFSSVVDFKASIDTGILSDTGNGTTGIIFGFEDKDNFFLFELSKFDSYKLARIEDGTWVTMINWTDIHRTNQDAYNMAISVEDSEAKMYVDRSFVGAKLLEGYRGGLVTMLASNYERAEMSLWFDNFILSD